MRKLLTILAIVAISCKHYTKDIPLLHKADSPSKILVRVWNNGKIDVEGDSLFVIKELLKIQAQHYRTEDSLQRIIRKLSSQLQSKTYL